MLLLVEFDKDLQESNLRYKVSVKDMFPKLWALGDDKLRKLSILLLDVERNPFFLMEYELKIVQLADRLGITPDATKRHYDSLKPSGKYHSVTIEYMERQNLVEYTLLRTCVSQARILAQVIDETPIDELRDSESKSFERSIKWGQEFVEFYKNYDIATQRVEVMLGSDIHEGILRDVVSSSQSPQRRADMLRESLENKGKK
jgi:hypothetical protein